MIIYSQWLSLPFETRNKIASQFGIAKVRPTHVSDNRVVEDGYLIKDIENALSIEAIGLFVGTEEKDPVILWNSLVDIMEGRADANVSVKVEEPGEEILDKSEEIEKPKATRKTKTK